MSRKGYYQIEQAAVASSRKLIVERLGKVPGGCDTCELDIAKRCASLAPGEAVLCELSDEDANVASEWRREVVGNRLSQQRKANAPKRDWDDDYTDEWVTHGHLWREWRELSNYA